MSSLAAPEVTLCPTNERSRNIVMSSLIGWAQGNLWLVMTVMTVSDDIVVDMTTFHILINGECNDIKKMFCQYSLHLCHRRYNCHGHCIAEGSFQFSTSLFSVFLPPPRVKVMWLLVLVCLFFYVQHQGKKNISLTPAPLGNITGFHFIIPLVSSKILRHFI